MNYSVFICDDEDETVRQIKDILKIASFCLSNNQDIRLSIFGTAENFMDAITFLNNHRLKGGIYFLDVELGEKINQDNGFDLAEYIKKNDSRAQIIFITSHADLSIITYQRRLGPIDYIVKTSNTSNLIKRITETLRRAIEQLDDSKLEKEEVFTYKFGRLIRKIPVNKIYYIITDIGSHKLKIICKNGIGQFMGTIRQVSEKPYFLQISQSCVINPNYADINIRERKIIFPNGDIQFYSRGYSKTIKNYFKNMKKN